MVAQMMFRKSQHDLPQMTSRLDSQACLVCWRLVRWHRSGGDRVCDLGWGRRPGGRSDPGKGNPSQQDGSQSGGFDNHGGGNSLGESGDCRHNARRRGNDRGQGRAGQGSGDRRSEGGCGGGGGDPRRDAAPDEPVPEGRATSSQAAFNRPDRTTKLVGRFLGGVPLQQAEHQDDAEFIPDPPQLGVEDRPHVDQVGRWSGGTGPGVGVDGGDARDASLGGLGP